jgi:hypothetical protein
MLPDDICRCRDDDCPVRTDCVRWLERNRGSQRMVSADSLFPFDKQSMFKPCPYRIRLAQARAGT